MICHNQAFSDCLHSLYPASDQLAVSSELSYDLVRVIRRCQKHNLIVHIKHRKCRFHILGKLISAKQKPEYVLINKPLGMVTTVSDDKERLTVMDVVADIDARLFPVGRLDYNTSGALIMTNDGELAYRLTHPKHEVYKTYRARVAGILSNEKAARLRKGVDIGGFVTSRAKVNIIKGTQHSTIVEIAIHEGKNRQVRKMFSAVGNPVQELERVAIGEIRLGHLKPGHYRKLTREEIEYLKNC